MLCFRFLINCRTNWTLKKGLNSIMNWYFSFCIHAFFITFNSLIFKNEIFRKILPNTFSFFELSLFNLFMVFGTTT